MTTNTADILKKYDPRFVELDEVERNSHPSPWKMVPSGWENQGKPAIKFEVQAREGVFSNADGKFVYEAKWSARPLLDSYAEVLEEKAALKTQLEEKEAQVKGLVEASDKAMAAFWMREGSSEGHKEIFFTEASKDLPVNVLSKALSTLPTTQLDLYRAEKAVIQKAKDWADVDLNDVASDDATTEALFYAVKALKEMEAK